MRLEPLVSEIISFVQGLSFGPQSSHKDCLISHDLKIQDTVVLVHLSPLGYEFSIIHKSSNRVILIQLLSIA